VPFWHYTSEFSAILALGTIPSRAILAWRAILACWHGFSFPAALRQEIAALRRNVAALRPTQ
jgi:hypothetical protein